MFLPPPGNGNFQTTTDNFEEKAENEDNYMKNYHKIGQEMNGSMSGRWMLRAGSESSVLRNQLSA